MDTRPESAALGKQVVVPSPDNFKVIVLEPSKSMLSAISSNPASRAACEMEIQHHPENYFPPVLYALAAQLFKEGKRDTAVFWMCAADLRTFIDIEICSDKSVEDSQEVLNDGYAEAILAYAQSRPELWRRSAEQALDWDEKAGCLYDRRWINFHGMGAFGVGDQRLSRPETEWPKLIASARDKYRKYVEHEIDRAAGKGHAR